MGGDSNFQVEKEETREENLFASLAKESQNYVSIPNTFYDQWNTGPHAWPQIVNLYIMFHQVLNLFSFQLPAFEPYPSDRIGEYWNEYIGKFILRNGMFIFQTLIGDMLLITSYSSGLKKNESFFLLELIIPVHCNKQHWQWVIHLFYLSLIPCESCYVIVCKD